jgi:hypothetical protein
MAFNVATSVGASMTAATGRPSQGHLVYAQNQGAFWCLYLTSTGSLSAAYSTNGGSSWSAPTGSPFTLAHTHSSQGRSFSFGYGNISSTDVLYMLARYSSSSNSLLYSRFTLGSTWTNTTAETSTTGTTSIDGNGNVLLPSNGKVILGVCTSTPATFYNVASNADVGSSWTAGFAGFTNAGSSAGSSAAMSDIGSGNRVEIWDNGAGSTWTNLTWRTFTPPSTNVSTGSVFASSVTATDANAWGQCAVSTSDIHVVGLSDNSSSYIHRRFNGSSWSAGDSIGSLAYGTNSGVSLVTDGTSVWAAVIDTSKNIQTNKWTSGVGWGGWSVLEATRANTPSYITGAYDSTNARIMWIWNESTGANFNIVGSLLTPTPAGGPWPFFMDNDLGAGFWYAST